MRRILSALLLITLTVATVTPVARADESDYWRLGDSINELTERERADLERLPGELADLPADVVEALFDDEVDHIESITEDELDRFVTEAKLRLKANGARHLMTTIKETFEDLRITSKRVLAIVYKEELRRLDMLPDAVFRKTVDIAFKRIIADRLRRFKNFNINVAHINASLNRPQDSYNWSTGTAGQMGADSRVLQDLVLLAKEDRFVRTLFEREIEAEWGTLNLVGAKVEGLANVKAGKLSYKDDFGRVHEGLGATFQVKTKFTVARADARTKSVELLKGQPINVSAMLLAKVVDIATNAELNSTNIVSRDGLIMHNEVTAGATVSANVRLPIDVDLSLFKVRVIPYAEAHVGVGAEAHFNLELEWTGRIAIDVGAAWSLGAGAGAGLRIEIMAGPMIEKLLQRVHTALVSFLRPIYDNLRGIHEGGPAFESGKLIVTEEQLREAWRDRPGLPTPLIIEAVAQQYAPVLYQEVDSAPHDYIRKIDFDGDLDGANNWQNSGGGSKRAHVYYDVKETATHWFIHYAWFYARRESNGLAFFRLMARHENDMAGVIVVVRKNAPRGRAVEAVMSAKGDTMRAYMEKDRRWDRRIHGDEGMGFSGEVRFIDEVDHPALDIERTHPQVYSSGRSHSTTGYNGRDDRDGFEGDEGVVYYPTGSAEEPESARDRFVGYKLLPLQQLMDQVRNRALMGRRVVDVGNTGWRLPEALRGRVGTDDSATLPWAWSHERMGNRSGPRDRTRDRVTVVEPGDMFADPAREFARLFRVNGPWSFDYTRRNPLAAPRARSTVESSGLGSELDRGGR